MSKFVMREDAVKEVPPEANWYIERKKEEKPKPIAMPNRTRSIALSGPLDGRVHEKVITNNKVLRLSGPLDGRMVYTNRSPMMPRPVDHGRLMSSAKSPRLSGPLENRSPRLTKASDAGADSPLGFSPYYYNKKENSGYDCYDDESTQWPALFQDLKPT